MTPVARSRNVAPGRIRSAAALLATLALSLVLSACGGGGSGGGTSTNPAPVTGGDSGGFVYKGPAPINLSVQRFQTAFYNNLVASNRCGTCHTRGGSGSTAFVDRNDVNYAYTQALTLVNEANPVASHIVDKVYSGGTGHNCWEASAAACRVQMISYLQNWFSDSLEGASAVKLAAPTDRDPNGGSGGFRSFPSEADYAGSQLYVKVKDYCSRCHSETSAVQQQPYFASSVVATSYAAIQSRVDLNDPLLFDIVNTPRAKSRLVVRLRDEFHNCWTADCTANAREMQEAIRQLALGVTPTTLDPGAYRSQGQVLGDGIVGVSGSRFESFQIALWRFLEGEGSIVSDTSGVAPAISLTVNGTEGETGNFKWIGGGGIQFNGAWASGTAAMSKKLYDEIAAGGEYTVEAWTLPGNTTDSGKSIVAYSDGGNNRNFLLGQTMYNYDYANRSSATNARGEVGTTKFASIGNLEALQAAQQYVAVTYDPVNGRKIYVGDSRSPDVALVSNAYPDDKGTLANDWSKTYSVVMGANAAGGDAWQGALRMVAVHKRALSPAQLAMNFAVPPGEKRYVMFNVSHIANMPASCTGTDSGGSPVSYCFVYFEVSQLDNYGYLFNRPHFISLNSDISDIDNHLEIQGIHIGINGKLAPVGQAFVNVDAVISTNPGATPHYVIGDEPGAGQQLADVGTVIPKLTGVDGDLFYLEFDKIGSNAAQAPAPVVSAFGFTLKGAVGLDLGWRTFDEVSATFSQLTGVPVTAQTGQPGVTVARVLSGVRSQLPAVADFSAYLSSHQTSVTQLAIAYCSALMNDSGYRQTFFAPVGTNLSDLKANNWGNLVDPLVEKFLSGGGLYYSPALSTGMHDELIALLTNSNGSRKAGLCAGGSCTTDAQIKNAATVACSAALANAAITLQ